MEKESIKETCCCSELDWAGFDLTAPHNPNCNAFVAARARLTDLPAVDGLRIMVDPAAPVDHVVRMKDLEQIVIDIVKRAHRTGRLP
jgi:hypothetical protein